MSDHSCDPPKHTPPPRLLISTVPAEPPPHSPHYRVGSPPPCLEVPLPGATPPPPPHLPQALQWDPNRASPGLPQHSRLSRLPLGAPHTLPPPIRNSRDPPNTHTPPLGMEQPEAPRYSPGAGSRLFHLPSSVGGARSPGSPPGEDGRTRLPSAL